MNLTGIVKRCFIHHQTPAVQLVRCLSTTLFSPFNCKTTPKPTTVSRTFIPSTIQLSKLLVPSSFEISSVRTYKAKNVLRLRCSGCYFEKRQGRLYVECTLKPRHKQMKKMPSGILYKDDYSEGKVHEGTWWKYRQDRYYKQGNTKFTNFNWLGDRLGKDI